MQFAVNILIARLGDYGLGASVLAPLVERGAWDIRGDGVRTY